MEVLVLIHRLRHHRLSETACGLYRQWNRNITIYGSDDHCDEVSCFKPRCLDSCHSVHLYIQFVLSHRFLGR